MKFKATSRRDFSKPREPIRGLGDLVHLATAPVRGLVRGLNECKGCAERRKRWNERFPL